MRISDWSSDVCSSDLPSLRGRAAALARRRHARGHGDRSDRRPGIGPAGARNVERGAMVGRGADDRQPERQIDPVVERSEEQTSELQSLMRISYAVFCLKKKKRTAPSTKHV